MPVFAAPSTPITRGRLTTDLDAGGHTVTNSNLATTNFVNDAIAGIEFPATGLSTNDVRAIVEAEAGPTNRLLHANADGALKMSDGDSAFPVILSGSADDEGTGGLKWDTHGFEGFFAPVAGYWWTWRMKGKTFVLPIMKGGTATNPVEIATTKEIVASTNGLVSAAEVAAFFTARTNLTSLSTSATVGDIVDRVNAVIGALHK